MMNHPTIKCEFVQERMNGDDTKRDNSNIGCHENNSSNFKRGKNVFREIEAAVGSSLLTCRLLSFFLTLNVFASISERILQKIFSFLVLPNISEKSGVLSDRFESIST